MKTVNIFSILLFIVLFGSGCADDSTEEPAQILEFTTVEKTNHSAINEQRFVTVREANAWDKLWAEHTKNNQPSPSAPLIDFKEAMVIGVFLGTRGNSCFSVTIEAVEQVAKKNLLVKYREVKSGPVCAAVETQPLHLISLKSINLPVEFAAQQ